MPSGGWVRLLRGPRAERAAGHSRDCCKQSPVIVAQRLRKGSTGSPRGGKRLVGDAVRTTRPTARQGPVGPRADGPGSQEDDHHDQRRHLDHDRVPRRRVGPVHRPLGIACRGRRGALRRVRRAEEVRPRAGPARGPPDPGLQRREAQGQRSRGILFDTWRFHAFFSTDSQVLDTVAADTAHRGHAIIERVHADLKDSALAHLPSGVFTANAAWLVLAVIAFNLTRAAGTVAAPDLARATTATLRHKLITVPARVATSARRVTLHLPRAWP